GAGLRVARPAPLGAQRAAITVWNGPTKDCPSAETAVTQTSAMNVIISAYSTIVAASSRATNAGTARCRPACRARPARGGIAGASAWSLGVADGGGDVGELGLEVRAEELDGRDQEGRDQRDHQAVLDHRGALFGGDELAGGGQQLGHRRAPGAWAWGWI